MHAQGTTISVTVPHGGLRRYSFQGIGFEHNKPVADRRHGWPVSRGVPLPEGAVRDVAQLRLHDVAGRLVPLHARPLATWPDGSIMFAFLQWQCDVAHDAPVEFTMDWADGEAASAPESPVAITESGTRIEMDNGPLHVVIDNATEGRSSLVLTRHGVPVIAGELNLWTRDAAGHRYHGVCDGIRIVENHPLVGIIELAGRHIGIDGTVFLNYTLQCRLDAGRDELELIHTFLNLGEEPDGVEVGEIGLRLPRAAGGPSMQVVCQNASGQKSYPRLAEFPEDARVHIGPTGPRVADLDSLREDTSGYPSYLMNNRDVVYPWIGLRTPDYAALVMIDESRENWPKEIAVSGDAIEYQLWTANSQLHELRQGMARHHHLRLSFFAPDAPLKTFQYYFHQTESHANVVVPFAWYQACRVFGMHYVMPWLPARYPRIEGAFMACAERGWATGMLGYGDDPNSGYDYSNVGLGKDIVWINNEHDYTSQACIQFWRSGRSAAWRGARVAAEHQIDVDFVRKSDYPWKVGGIPAHCARHTTASVYPSHTWTEGLLHYYLTSGDTRALDVAISLGRNLCKYAEEFLDVMDIESRMPGWALIALAALIEVTQDARCLQAAHIIRDHIQEAFDAAGTYDRAGMEYATGTLLTGLGHLHRITGDEQALRLMLGILDWHLVHGRNATGMAWEDGNLHAYTLNLTLPVYAYAYHATGDRKYLDEGLAFLRFTGRPGAIGDIRGGAKQYRTYMPFLLLAHEAGMLDELERLPVG